MRALLLLIFLISLAIQAHAGPASEKSDDLCEGASRGAALGAPAGNIEQATWLEEAVHRIGGGSTQQKIQLLEFIEGVAAELPLESLANLVVFMTWGPWNADTEFKIYLWRHLLQPDKFEIPQILLRQAKLLQILRGMLFKKVPQKFLLRAREALDEHPIRFHRELRNIIRASLLPAAAAAEPVFALFLKHPRELESADPEALKNEAQKILGLDLLSDQAFTRRTMAYIGAHPELKQEEKLFLFMNMVNRYRATGGIYVYNPGPILSDGTRIILGAKNSTYFLAFTPDEQSARVFWGSFMGAVEADHDFDFEHWRILPSIVEAAGN